MTMRPQRPRRSSSPGNTRPARCYAKLEDRILFDAAPAAPSANSGDQSPLPDAFLPDAEDVQLVLDGSLAASNDVASSQAQSPRRELVLVDSHVVNYEALVQSLKTGQESDPGLVDVVILDAARDGVGQVSEILSKYEDLGAVHLISHGDEQSVQLGSTWLNANNLGAHAASLSQWSNALRDDADLLFYGCDLAATQEGRLLLDGISALTGADIAASVDDTGHASLGGDWDLEYTLGAIESSSPLSQEGQAAYQGMLSAAPLVTIAAPSEVMLGEDFQFTVSFDNNDPNDTGFAPYVDVYLPQGADGDDGITINQATYLGVTLAPTTLTFVDDGFGTGVVAHPYAVNSSGAPVIITGVIGDRLVVYELPFGSFAPDQPPAPIVIDATLSNLADLSTPLLLRAGGGFRLGNTPISDPAVDPSILTPSLSDALVTPTLVRLTKTYLGPENETATGPNFPRSYRIDVDVADGQTITNLDITDLLPDGLVYQGVSSAPVGASIVEPAAGTLTNNDTLVVTLASITGGPSASDASIVWDFYVPDLDAGGADVVPHPTGDDVTVENNVAALGDWTPLDPRDPAGTGNVSIDETGPEEIFTAKSIAVQKSVAIVSNEGPAGASPGDVLEYTIDFQVSDYFAFNNLSLQDMFSDGQRLDASFTPTLTLSQEGVDLTSGGAWSFVLGDSYSATLNADNDPTTPATDGGTTLGFDLSEIMRDNGQSGALYGGLIPGRDNPVDGANDGATRGVITFRTIIQDAYSDDYPPGSSPSLDENDTLNNTVTIQGDLLDPTTLIALGTSEADGSGASVNIEVGSFVKSIFAKNGVIDAPLILAAGQTITYRLTYDLAFGDFENMMFDDYLPQPIFDVTDPNADGVGGPVWTQDLSGGATPASGTWMFGPDHTLPNLIVPTVTTDAVSNRLTFNFGTREDAANEPQTVDILFTITAGNDPFADSLYLTNQATHSETNTFGTASDADAIVQVFYGEPVLNISKGVLSVDASADAGASFTAAVGPTAAINEIQTLASIGAPTSGSFTLRFGGVNSTVLNFNATAAEVQTALESIPALNGNVNVTGGDLPTDSIAIEFVGALAGTDVAPLTVANSTIDGAGDGNEVQTLTFATTPSGGSFTLQFEGVTTGPIDYNATAATMEAALELLPGIDDVVVTGDAPNQITIEFQGAQANQNVSQLVLNDSGLIGVNEVQQLEFDAAPTAGSYTLRFGAAATNAIAFDADAAAVQTALEGLATIGAGNVMVSGGPAPASFVIEFVGALAEQAVGQITGDDALLVGAALTTTTTTQGHAPGATLSTTTQGSDSEVAVNTTAEGAGVMTYLPPGSPTAFSGGRITSQGLATTPINANLNNLDAGDRVTFAIVVENTGTGENGAFDVVLRDMLPVGFAAPVEPDGSESASHRWRRKRVDLHRSRRRSVWFGRRFVRQRHSTGRPRRQSRRLGGLQRLGRRQSGHCHVRPGVG